LPLEKFIVTTSKTLSLPLEKFIVTTSKHLSLSLEKNYRYHFKKFILTT
jgi:hypothetical protein